MEAVRYMVHCRLNLMAEVEVAALVSEPHPDEDVMNAFIEGRTAEYETRSIVAHLTACSSCRVATARLIRIELMFNFEDDSPAEPEAPSRWRQFIGDLASQLVPPTGEDAVFAYQHSEEDRDPNDQDLNEKPEDKP